jgi:hypothetical protein
MSRINYQRWLFVIAECLFASIVMGVLLISGPVHRSVLAVNTLCVNPLDPGHCYTSIQAAVNAASSGDTIQIANYTYKEAVSIGKNLTLIGSSRRYTQLDGENVRCPLTINSPAKVSVSSLYIRNGKNASGGGVYNSGTLTITAVTIHNNYADVAGGIDNDGTLHLDNVYLGYNGALYDSGGLRNNGTAILNNVTVQGNTANSFGSGITNYGSLFINQTSFYTNTASSAGGLYNHDTAILIDVTFKGNKATQYGGGGILNDDGVITLTNVTLSGNTASSYYGGGIQNAASSGTGKAWLVNVTLSGNSALSGGGGIYHSNNPQTYLKNTILSNNISGNCNNTGANLISEGYNLEDVNLCGLHATGDLTNTNPMLAPLALYPPGSLFTIALKPGSPAIDHGTNAGCPSTDERGIHRPIDGDLNGATFCDIGAYEKTLDIYLPIVMK